MTRNFREMLEAKWAEGKFVCVGLDSDLKKIPESIQAVGYADKIIVEFNKKIIDATHDLVCAYKPNIAFYEAWRSDGIEALLQTVLYINQVAPTVPVILDAKRADIG